MLTKVQKTINRIEYNFSKEDIESIIEKYKIKIKEIDTIFNKFYATKIRLKYLFREAEEEKIFSYRMDNNLGIEMEYVPDLTNSLLTIALEKNHPFNKKFNTYCFRIYCSYISGNKKYLFKFKYSEPYEDVIFPVNSTILLTPEEKIVCTLYHYRTVLEHNRISEMSSYPSFTIFLINNDLYLSKKNFNMKYESLFYLLNMMIIDDVIRILKSKELKNAVK